MYNWLAHATAEVRWKKFFVFKKDADPKALAQTELTFGPLPEDYKKFVVQFGESRLFRRLTDGSYNLGVFSRPRILEGYKGELLLEIGFFINGGYAHLRKPEGRSGPEAGIFEGAGLQVRKTADSFEEWVKKRFESAKKLYKRKDWKRVVEGAAPFSEEELKIVEAMQRFSFERVGTADNGNMLIKVHNDSALRLRFLTVGARAKGRLEGGVFLDVSGIGPGETKVIEHDCYKSLVPADRIELFRKPAPEPEERDMFYEFGAPDWMPHKGDQGSHPG